MKLKFLGFCGKGLKSRPSRARGLKQALGLVSLILAAVAPLAGAWIETTLVFAGLLVTQVAPLAGAWIETKPNDQVRAISS